MKMHSCCAFTQGTCKQVQLSIAVSIVFCPVNAKKLLKVRYPGSGSHPKMTEKLLIGDKASMQTKQIIYHFLYFAITPLLISTLEFAAKLELSEVFAIAPPPPHSVIKGRDEFRALLLKLILCEMLNSNEKTLPEFLHAVGHCIRF